MLNYFDQTMERVALTRPRLTTCHQPPSVAAVLTGDLAELDVLRAVFSIASLLKAGVCISWVGPGNPGRALMRELASGGRFEELDLGRLFGLYLAGRIQTTVVPAALWRRTAPTLWPMLNRSSLLVCRRGIILPSSILVCADNEATERALIMRVSAAVPSEAVRLSVLRAIPLPPTWAWGLSAMYGFAWVPAEDEVPAARADQRPYANTITSHEPTADAIHEAWRQLTPDLVVLGWHRHALPLPVSWLHPTAWRLSNQLASDVLLVPA